MPIETIPSTDLHYYLIAYDAEGRERGDDRDGIMSQRVCAELAQQGLTDIFLFSHGWKGDVPSALQDYASWLTEINKCPDDLEQLRKRRNDYRSAFVGLHWPSQPWGDEKIPANAALSFALEEAVPEERLVEAYVQRIADTPAARQALHTIFRAAARQPAPPTLPEEVRAAYVILSQEARLGSDGPGADPGSDSDPFDPEDRYQLACADAPVSFGIGSTLGNLLLSPLRQLSFWKMKDRARRFGESGAHRLLRSLQAARPDVRLHLMGHSFGSVVMSAATAGPPGGERLSRPVQSLVLVQGALSLWSYCADIPYRRGRPGYFRPVIDGGRVAGPIVTTQSQFDLAVGRWYPLAAGVARQIEYGVRDPSSLPRYGGVGTFGLRGGGLDFVDDEIKDVSAPYDFWAGRVHNLESSRIIHKSDGASGAHSDIAHAEIGHIIWSAALV